MNLASLLFVPADSERKFQKARNADASALIFDLEDSVAPAQKSQARESVADWIDAERGEATWKCLVRINPFDTGMTQEDLNSIVRPGLDGIVLPKAGSAEDVARLSDLLDPLEAAAGMEPGVVKIIAIATETPQAIFQLGSYASAHPRLAGLSWGAEDLAAATGASANRNQDGSWTTPYQMVRSLCLFAAAAAGVPAFDTIYADFRDRDGLERDSRIGRRDGFSGRLAIHPDQIEPIHRAFAPSDEELALARQIVDAFDRNPDLGVVGIGGKMYDIPHLKQARRILAWKR